MVFLDTTRIKVDRAQNLGFGQKIALRWPLGPAFFREETSFFKRDFFPAAVSYLKIGILQFNVNKATSFFREHHDQIQIFVIWAWFWMRKKRNVMTTNSNHISYFIPWLYTLTDLHRIKLVYRWMSCITFLAQDKSIKQSWRENINWSSHSL